MSDRERWLPIPGYECCYEVSDQGRIRSTSRMINRGGRPSPMAGRILKPSVSATGYRHVTLNVDGKKFTQLIHRAVLMAFRGECPPGMETRQLDGNPANNVVSNLEWNTHSRNNLDRVEHGTHHYSRRDRCIRGHELPPRHPDTAVRVCRKCAAARKVERLERADFPHDTAHGYSYGCRCHLCRSANSAYRKSLREKK